MKIPPRNLESFVKKPDPAVVAFLVYGPDEGLVRERAMHLTKSVVADVNDPFNVAEFTGEQLLDQPSRLLDEAQAISMLGGRRVVRLRDATDKCADIVKEAVAQLRAGDNMVVITAGELGTTSKLRKMFEAGANIAPVPCYVDDARDISRVIQESLREQGFRISSDALMHMAENIVGDRAVARGEVEKLVTYMGPQRDIDIDDVTACVGASASLPIDDIAKNIASGKFAEGERVLRLLLSEGTAAVQILRNLQNYFTRLYMTRARMNNGDSLDVATGKLRPPLFFKNKPAFEAQVSAWSVLQLEQALALLVQVETRCKQSGADPELLCSRAMLSLSQMGARALKRRA